jgi:flagellar hook protein FlgE
VININQLSAVNVRVVNGLAAATTDVELGANLDAGQTAFAGAYAAGDLAAFSATGGVAGVQPHMVRAVQVFDPLGGAHNLQIAFLKDPAANTWNVEVYADPADVEAASHPNGLLASGTITFNGDGTLASTNLTPNYPAAVAGAPVGINWLDASGQNDSSVTLDLGTVGAADGLPVLEPYNITFVIQNGAEVGELTASPSTRKATSSPASPTVQRRRSTAAIATFANPLALDPRTGNAARPRIRASSICATPAAAAPARSPVVARGRQCRPGGRIHQMIVTQRAYSANARVITTTDEMLDELIRISR